MKQYLLVMLPFFLLQVFSYGIVTFNYRMISMNKRLPAILSDAAIALFNFFVIKKVAESGSNVAAIGYMLGSVIGTYIGMWITDLIYGKEKKA